MNLVCVFPLLSDHHWSVLFLYKKHKIVGSPSRTYKRNLVFADDVSRIHKVPFNRKSDAF